ncbi:MAG: UDP-N-acetylmuramate dehydrogenase [Candidatus Sericytochromatia bacterium]|nr:UDP-N-acetylmuramate dehydrogenase [Candidatus Sericytochromatia bacterium]
MEVKENHLLKEYNTFKIEVKAKYFVEVNDIDELKNILLDKKYSSQKKMILGGGSNILFTQDFDGLIIKINLLGINIFSQDEHNVTIKAGAGENWHDFVLYCIYNNFSGLENLSLIPGTVGASPIQNIGAYGVEIKDVFVQLEALDISTGNIRIFDYGECDFSYRGSIFKYELKNKYIIVSVTYKLKKNPVFNVSYGAIRDTLDSMGITELSAKYISDAVISIRSSKLPDPKILGNAGSFFKNPEVSQEHFIRLKAQYPNIVSYKTNTSNIKIPAGWLIEALGWKGKTFDNYGVHQYQALVIVNYGGSNGSDIKNLANDIIKSIFDKFEINLEIEVNII